MKILILADEESKYLWDFFTPDKLEGIDLIISCGDLRAEYLEFLVTMGKAPVLYVPGNHDSRYEKHPPEGCENVDGKVVTVKGIRVLGFGGSMKYGIGPYMYTEKEMRKRIKKSRRSILVHSGFDILVTHSPARGYGDMDDIPHRGFECFNELLERCKPKYLLHGHVHATYGNRFKRVIDHPSGARIINGFDRYILEYDESRKCTLSRKDILKQFYLKLR
ncbi:MAG: metallophosphoesterase family protein [Ruminococcus sp.]|nr:metallophosphoesterase family protein [Ruminococcus sp.]MBR2305407.1 metallophosphoesterase family protein [Ruminococcus sp.]